MMLLFKVFKVFNRDLKGKLLDHKKNCQPQGISIIGTPENQD